MTTPTIQNTRQYTDPSTKESLSDAKGKKFRELFKNTVEKTEEREPKKRSIFDIAGETVILPPPTPFQPQFNTELAIESTISPISKQQVDLIISTATCGITHCIDNGVKETTICLDGLSFENSPLYKSEIVIREFSTAPLAFNVEFRCSPTALAFLQPQLAALSAAFHFEHKKDYAIHRIDAMLDDSSPFLFHRKPASQSGHNDRGG